VCVFIHIRVRRLVCGYIAGGPREEGKSGGTLASSVPFLGRKSLIYLSDRFACVCVDTENGSGDD